MPMTFMDGAKVKAWNWVIWIALFFLLMFLFFWIIVYKGHGDLTEAAINIEGKVILGMMVFFLVLSSIIWIYFKARYKSVLVHSGNVSEHNIPDQPVRCPKCGSETTTRIVETGPNAGRQFHVCTQYPECKGRIALE